MKVIKVIFGLLACCMMFSCQQMPEDDTWGSEENTKVLKVKVRSAGESEIQYPLYLYAFTEGGKLAASQTIENAEVDMSLTLPKGDYQVVAVAGVSDSYQLPESPKLTDVITLAGATYSGFSSFSSGAFIKSKAESLLLSEETFTSELSTIIASVLFGFFSLFDSKYEIVGKIKRHIRDFD